MRRMFAILSRMMLTRYNFQIAMNNRFFKFLSFSRFVEECYTYPVNIPHSVMVLLVATLAGIFLQPVGFLPLNF